MNIRALTVCSGIVFLGVLFVTPDIWREPTDEQFKGMPLPDPYDRVFQSTEHHPAVGQSQQGDSPTIIAVDTTQLNDSIEQFTGSSSSEFSPTASLESVLRSTEEQLQFSSPQSERLPLPMAQQAEEIPAAATTETENPFDKPIVLDLRDDQSPELTDDQEVASKLAQIYSGTATGDNGRQALLATNPFTAEFRRPDFEATPSGKLQRPIAHPRFDLSPTDAVTTQPIRRGVSEPVMNEAAATLEKPAGQSINSEPSVDSFLNETMAENESESGANTFEMNPPETDTFVTPDMDIPETESRNTAIQRFDAKSTDTRVENWGNASASEWEKPDFGGASSVLRQDSPSDNSLPAPMQVLPDQQSTAPFPSQDIQPSLPVATHYNQSIPQNHAAGHPSWGNGSVVPYGSHTEYHSPAPMLEQNHLSPLHGTQCPDCQPNSVFAPENCMQKNCFGGENPVISVGGWLSGGYHSADNQLFNSRPDQFALHQGWLYAEKSTSHESPLGFRVDAMYGIDADDTQAFGNNPGEWDFANGMDFGSYGWAVPQAYLELKLGEWNVRAGHFFTLIGYEVVGAPDNFFYSHAITMYNSEPFTHTGVIANRRIGDFDIYAGWTLGWDTGFDQFGEGGSWLGGFSWDMSDSVTLSYFSTAGDFGARGSDAYSQSLVFNIQATEDLNYVLQSDFLRVGSTGEQNVGVNQYVTYALSDCVSIGTRIEWWKGDVLTGYAPHGAVLPTNGLLSYYAATFGVNVKPTDSLVIRPEVRHDWSPAANYAETYFGIDAVWSF